MSMQGFALGTVAVACALACASPANAAATTVYKCFDRNLGVVYTDEPCRGEQLSIETGSVDPVAIAELQRERDAVARSAAQRVAELRALPAPVQPYAYADVPPMPDYAYADTYYPAWTYGGYYGNYHRDRDRLDAARNDRRQRYVPAPKGDLIKR